MGRTERGCAPGSRVIGRTGGLLEQLDDALIVLIEQLAGDPGALSGSDAGTGVRNDPHGSP